MSDEEHMVTEFYRAFGIAVGISPAMPDEVTCALRIRSIQQELDELQAAFAHQDVVVVAKELTERGLSVLMLEAGPPRIPTRDFTEHIWPYQLKFRGFGDQQRLLKNQPVQRLC